MLELQLLLAIFSAWAKRRQGSVIAYLVEENRVLKEKLETGCRLYPTLAWPAPPTRRQVGVLRTFTGRC